MFFRLPDETSHHHYQPHRRPLLLRVDLLLLRFESKQSTSNDLSPSSVGSDSSSGSITYPKSLFFVVSWLSDKILRFLSLLPYRRHPLGNRYRHGRLQRAPPRNPNMTTPSLPPPPLPYSHLPPTRLSPERHQTPIRSGRRRQRTTLRG